MKRVFLLLVVIGIIFQILIPAAFAAPGDHTTGGASGADSGTTGGAPGADNGSTGGASGADSGINYVPLKNPLDSSISSIPAFFLAILDILLVFAIPFVVFFIIYAGYMYVMAQGNPGALEKANKALLYAILGGLLIFGARAILQVIEGTVESVTIISIERIIG